MHFSQRMEFDDLHANCDKRAEKIAPNTKPVGPHAPNAEKTILRFKPTGKVVPTSAIAFGTKIAGPIPWKPRVTLSMTEPFVLAA